MKPILTLLLESFRGLKSQLIFWITLGLSLLVALIFLSIGFDDEGMTFFFGLTGFAEENLAEEGPFRSIVYKMIFSNAIGGFWLTWIATILALISCAPIFPNTMTEGGAGMVMTKGVPRLQIFAAKFVGSLFFVTIQVGLFMVIVFIAFKWRLGVWYPQLFWYLPAVLLVFVSLYSFLVLVAVKPARY
jgi:ABC-type transport system involved in multi-copper enzyme maturation permease subunit